MAAPPKKSQYWQQLKTAAEMGVPVQFEKAYVSYTEVELADMVNQYLGDTYGKDPVVVEEGQIDTSAFDQALVEADTLPHGGGQAAPVSGGGAPVTGGHSASQTVAPADAPDISTWGQYPPQKLARLLDVPFSDLSSRRAGLTFNTHGPDDVLRVDSQGRVWYKDEVPKPAVPLPRMRRKVRYVNSGVKMVERRGSDGRLDESFEVAGNRNEEAEIKITLPSSQVGIYYDPRLPFRVHIYNGLRGFDYMDVLRFYGGSDLVPVSMQESEIYVGDDLCFDINKTRSAMEQELRNAQLGRS